MPTPERIKAEEDARALEVSLQALVEKADVDSWLLQVQPETALDTEQVQQVLANLQEQTARQYVAFYNPQTGYVLVTLRG